MPAKPARQKLQELRLQAGSKISASSIEIYRLYAHYIGMLVSSVVFPRAAVAGQIGDRQIRQQERIHQGVVTGELTGREAAALEREQCRIQKIKQRAWTDGELSPVERARVHNLKVYLLSYLTALLGFMLFVPMFPHIPNGPPLFIITALSQFNLLIIALLPSYVKYRTTRLVTWIIVAGELAFMILVMLQKIAIPVSLQEGQTNIQTWTLVYWSLLILLLTFVLMRKEFHLGGIITGCSYFYAVIILSLMGRIPKQQLTPILFIAAQLYLIVGIVLHWFSRTEHRVSYDPLLQKLRLYICKSGS